MKLNSKSAIRGKRRPSGVTRGDFLRGLAALGAVAVLPGSRASGGQPSAGRPVAAGTRGAAYDMREFLDWALNTFEPTIKLPGAGHYARTPGGTLELYGVADMACVLYSVGRLHPNEKDRAEWADAFHAFAQPETGWFIEKSPTHAALHNLAFSLGAMELLDLSPRNSVILGSEYADIKTYLNTLDWKTAVYTESHKGAGIGAIHTFLPDHRKKEWFESYFAFCDSLVDPHNGLMGREKPPGGDFDQIGGTFHYFFLYNHFNRHMAFPEKRIDTILGLQRTDGHWDSTNRTWLTLDAIYLLTRTLRQSPHRVDEVRAAIGRTMDALMADMYSPAARPKAFGGRLPAHTLTCAVSILAEVQQFWGAGRVITEWPLKLVLDRRPFI